jgi:hypothetical protein
MRSQKHKRLKTYIYASQEWLVNAIFESGSPTGTTQKATIQRSDESLSPPDSREIWQLERIYYYGTDPNPDFQLIVMINSYEQPYRPNASTVNVTKKDFRYLPQSIPIPRRGSIGFAIVNLAPVGLESVSITFRVKIAVITPRPRKKARRRKAKR